MRQSLFIAVRVPIVAVVDDYTAKCLAVGDASAIAFLETAE